MTSVQVQVGAAKGLLVHVPGSPLASVNIRIDAGGRDDPDGKSGLAHAVEHMVCAGDRSSGNRGSGGFERWIHDMGGFTNANTSADWTTYFHVVPVELLGTVLVAEADRFLNAPDAMRAEHLTSEKNVVQRERNERVTSPAYGNATETLLRLSYGTSPYRLLPVGSHDDVAALTVEDCRAFVNRYYAAERVNMVVVGGFDMRAAYDSVVRVLSTFPVGVAAAAGEVGYRAPTAAIGQREVRIRTRSGPRIFLAVGLPAARLPDYDLAELGSVILGRGVTSILVRRLVHELRIARHIALRITRREWDKSLGIVEITPQPGVSVQELLDRLDDAMETLLADGVPAADARRGRAVYTSLWSAEDDSLIQRAGELSLAMQERGSVERYTGHLARIAELTGDDFRTAVATWHDPAARTMVVYE